MLRVTCLPFYNQYYTLKLVYGIGSSLKQFSINVLKVLLIYPLSNNEKKSSIKIFYFFSNSNNKQRYNFNSMNCKKHKWCTWDSNSGPHDCGHRRNHGAMAAPYICRLCLFTHQSYRYARCRKCSFIAKLRVTILKRHK